jgi:RHS repeat-associated protein
VGGRPVTHDPNGNVTAYGADAYTWDVRGRLVKLTRTGLTVEFTYDPWGDRTSKKVNGTLTKFLLDGEDVVSEVTGTTTVNTLQGPTTDQPLARNGRYFSANELGSTTTLTDGAGAVVQSYSYSPFGKVTQSTGESNPFQYAGRENDGTGLYFNRRRYYVPEWGRFLSEDPLGLEGGLNRYTYAGNDPINWTDPSGTTAVFGPDYWGPYPKSLVDRVITWWNEDPPPPIWTPAFWRRFLTNFGEDAYVALGILRELPELFSASDGGGGSGGARPRPSSPKVKDVLRTKRGSIKNAELEPGSPSWDQIQELTLEEIGARARQGLPGYKTLWKLLTSKRFNK